MSDFFMLCKTYLGGYGHIIKTRYFVDSAQLMLVRLEQVL